MGNNYTINFEGINLLCREYGDFNAPKKILILHGWTSTGATSWENFINSKFQNDIEKGNVYILVPDMPGFGQSSAPGEVWNAEKYADFMAGFIKQKFVVGELITLLGHSFGGAVASIISAKYSELINKLVLAAPAIVRPEINERQKLTTEITKYGKKVVKGEFVKKVWYKLIGSPDYGLTNGIMKEIMQTVIRQDLQYVLPEIKQNTTILWGTEDTYTPYYQAEIVNQGIKNSKLITLNGVNHGIHLYAQGDLYRVLMS